MPFIRRSYPEDESWNAAMVEPAAQLRCYRLNKRDHAMRQLLIGAVLALPLVFSALPANAMPVAPQTSSIVDAVTSDIIEVKGGHGHGWGHGWGRGHGHRAYGWGRGRKVGWGGHACPPGQWKKWRC